MLPIATGYAGIIILVYICHLLKGSAHSTEKELQFLDLIQLPDRN